MVLNSLGSHDQKAVTRKTLGSSWNSPSESQLGDLWNFLGNSLGMSFPGRCDLQPRAAGAGKIKAQQNVEEKLFLLQVPSHTLY